MLWLLNEMWFLFISKALSQRRPTFGSTAFAMLDCSIIKKFECISVLSAWRTPVVCAFVGGIQHMSFFQPAAFFSLLGVHFTLLLHTWFHVRVEYIDCNVQ